MYDKPSEKECDFVACRFCKKQWSTWVCKNGMTTTIRDHFQNHHYEEWRQSVIENKLKGWEELASKLPAGSDATNPSGSSEPAPEPFTLHGLRRRIIRWIVGDDQAINVVENDLFREVIRYASTSPIPLQDKDIPHRTYAHSLIISEYESAIQDLRRDLQVGCITLDNASNCETMMEDLARLLEARGISFSRDGNRLRCFPHVVNISVKHGLKNITDGTPTGAPEATSASSGTIALSDVVASATLLNCQPPGSLTDPESHSSSASTFDAEEVELLNVTLPSLLAIDAESNAALQADEDYADALARDPIKRARQLIAACRASSLRREAFQEAIREAKQAGDLAEVPSDTQLLRDVDTRWSSVLFMIDRLLELYPAVQIFLSKDSQKEIAHFRLSSHDLRVLDDIRGFLRIPHHVQQILSATQSPTAPLVLPTYEELLDLLKLARVKYAKLAHAIAASITILESYMKHTRRTRVYALAMVINPAVKFHWIVTNKWPAQEQAAVKDWLIEAVFEHRKHERHRAQALENIAPSTPALSSAAEQTSLEPRRLEASATHAQHSGFAMLEALRRELSSSSLSSADSGAGLEQTESSSAPEESDADREERLDNEDEKAAEQEVERYLSEERASATTNILDYWE
ncbi:hypothetical protein V8D89_009926, partial [Ganoderma adspersum]